MKCGCLLLDSTFARGEKGQNDFYKSIKILILLNVSTKKVGGINCVVLSHNEKCKSIYSDSKLNKTFVTTALDKLKICRFRNKDHVELLSQKKSGQLEKNTGTNNIEQQSSL